MKSVYISHSSNMDYEKELYQPLLSSKLAERYNFIFPHNEKYKDIDTKNILIKSSCLIAGVSFPGTGIGLELGRAECHNIPVICFIKKGKKCSSSVKRNFKVIEYYDEKDLVHKLEMVLQEME